MALVARASRDIAAPGRVERALDGALLANAGYDAATHLWAPPADHPVFGWRVCPVTGCSNITVPKSGSVLCAACAERLRRQREAERELSVERFVATVSKQNSQGTVAGPRYTRATEPLCRVCCVPGHERPAAANGLCEQCSSQCHHRRQSIEAFVAGDERFKPGRPKPTFGECHVDGCDRWACTGSGLCCAHDPAWRRAGRPRGQELDEFLELEAVRMLGPHALKPRQLRVASAKEVDLGVIDPTLRVELLMGLQESARLGRQVPPHVLVSVLKVLEKRCVRSTLEITALSEISSTRVREFISNAREAVRLASSDPDSEAANDVWDLRVFGSEGRADFSAVAPDWLRAGAKSWALEKVGTVHRRSITRVIESLD